MCKSKDLAYSSSLTRIFMHFKVPLSCTPLKPGNTLSKSVITKSVSAKRVVTKKTEEAGTSAAAASASGSAQNDLPRRSRRRAPLVPPSRRIAYINDHHSSTPEPPPMAEDDTLQSRLTALEAQMKNIVHSFKDLKKSAGGQLDKVIDEASDFKFKMCMVEQRIRRMSDDMNVMGDKVKDMGEKVTAYGKAVALMSSQLSKIREDRKLDQDLARNHMDGVLKSFAELDTKVTYIFNKLRS